jgi:hypothetical protein
MRILIAGSSGFLGTRLRAGLVNRGHTTTPLVRRPPSGEGEIQWDPYAGALDQQVVDAHDVVVNLAGSPLIGNPHSRKWAKSVMNSRVTTTRVLAEAIAASATKPAFLAGNGISFYGDHGSEPLTEQADSRGEALLTRVARAWQEAAEPARAAGARVCVLRTAPIYDRRSQPLGALRLQFAAGLGGRLGDGTQYVPMISARDWVDAVIHLAQSATAQGPFNLCCAKAPTNAELTAELAHQLNRRAVLPVPAFVLRRAAGQMSDELLGSVNCVPSALVNTGFQHQDPDVTAVLREGLDPSR